MTAEGEQRAIAAMDTAAREIARTNAIAGEIRALLERVEESLGKAKARPEVVR